MQSLPRNKIEGVIFGIFMCLLMVIVMSFFNICLGVGAVNEEALIAFAKSFWLIFLVAFAVENIIVQPINNLIINKVYKERANTNAVTLFNAIIIVTMMSLIMTFLGGLVSGIGIETVLSNFLISWPRNFCVAMFCNLLFAGPLARLILKGFQVAFDKKRNKKASKIVCVSQQKNVAQENLKTNLNK